MRILKLRVKLMRSPGSDCSAGAKGKIEIKFCLGVNCAIILTGERLSGICIARGLWYDFNDEKIDAPVGCGLGGG